MLWSMVESAEFCARVSEQAQEPVAGTAPASIAHWLLVEDNGPWGPKEPNALALLAPELAEAWAEIGKMPGMRRIYVRRPKQLPTMPDAKRRFWLATEGEQGFGVFALEASSITQFVEHLQLQGLTGLLADASRCDDLWLVCTHGRRDRCCSLYGMSLFSALDRQSAGEVWQCSHLGGHRFAATALHLPSRYLWGRLTEADAGALARVGPTQRLALPEKLRGHSGLSRGAQVLELGLRRRREAWGFACAPEILAMDPQDRALTVPEGRLELQAGPSVAVLGSCGDEVPKQRSTLTARWG